jgi:hypothetical protein
VVVRMVVIVVMLRPVLAVQALGTVAAAAAAAAAAVVVVVVVVMVVIVVIVVMLRLVLAVQALGTATAAAAEKKGESARRGYTGGLRHYRFTPSSLCPFRSQRCPAWISGTWATGTSNNSRRQTAHHKRTCADD